MVAIADKDARCQRIEQLITAGCGVCESCRAEGVSEKTYYRWRKVRAAGVI